MVGKDILTCMKNGFVSICQLVDDVLHPSLACAKEFAAIDVSLAHIVVGIDDGKVFLQILFRKGDVSADIIVAVCSCPRSVDVRIFVWRAKSTSLSLPACIVETLCRPSCSAGGSRLDLSFPRSFVGHRCNRGITGMEAKFVLVESDVCQGAAFSVVNMEGNDVVTFHESRFGRSSQVHFDVLTPLLFRHIYHLHTIDIRLAYVVVGIDDPKVVAQIFRSKCDMTADIAVCIVSTPSRLDVGILVRRSPRTHLIGPSRL